MIEEGPQYRVNSDSNENHEHYEHIEVATPLGDLKVNTGNMYTDIGIFGVAVLLWIMFIYGKFYIKSKKDS